jgi:hypothetical protein|tara:strand:+ start:1294 stop:1482 length:189 start_codon:yes stop_codon:yes gene_type:complete
MARRYWKRNSDGELVEFFPNQKSFADGPLSNHINMRKTWSGQTQVEFSQTTMDQDIADRNRR